jgi:hypothetical protein
MHCYKIWTEFPLERLDILLETQNTNNWKSAAEHAGFATPGYQNSQYIAITESDEFTIIPKVISPDNDGLMISRELL